MLNKEDIFIPDEIQKSKILTDYAVEMRYPGDYESVTEKEYKKTLKIAEKVVLWVEKKLE